MVTSMTRLRVIVATVFRLAVSFIVMLVGRWRWQPPAWLSFIAQRIARGWRFLIAKPSRAIAVVVALLVATSAVAWYASRPKPHHVTYTVSAPGLTEYNEKGISSIKPLKVTFAESAAPLK